MMEFLQQPWPWYVTGPLLGIIVPILLLVGNKSLGISTSLRHICAIGIPAGIDFFKYNWREERWVLYFALGLFLGGALGGIWLANPQSVAISQATIDDLQLLGIRDFEGLAPKEIFSWENLLTLQGLIFTLGGGFLVGFGTRYANGCTSGHVIFGLSSLQWPSLVAALAFMAGGFVCTHLILPYLL